MDIKPTAKVVLVTTKGKIEIELYAKELPLLCKPFIANCVNKKYVGLEFEKVTSGLIQSLQIESTTEIKREKNQRIKFNSRGAVGLLRVDGTRFSSASGFFISLEPTSEYGPDYLFIGNVVGDSIYNVVKIKDSELKPQTESPLYPVTITDCYAPEPYFDGLEERTIVSENSKKRKKQKTTVTLDYDMEGDDEIEDTSSFVVRSAHELLAEKKHPKAAPSTENKPAPKTPAEIPSVQNSSHDENNDKVLQSQVLDKTTQSTESELPVETTETSKQEETPDKQTSTSKQNKPVRDFSIDPYDPELDFSEDEITYETLRKHKFICR